MQNTIKRSYTQYRPSFDARQEKELMKPVEELKRLVDPKGRVRAMFLHNLATVEFGHSWLNLYVPSAEFCDWLVGCTGDLCYRKHMLAVQEHADKVLGRRQCFNCAVINFPTSAKRGSMLFAVIRKDSDINETVLTDDNFVTNQRDFMGGMSTMSMGKFRGKDALPFDVLLMEGTSESDLFTPKEALSRGEWALRLVCDLGMYLGCFPECVKAGPPADLRHPAHHKGAALSFEVSPRVRAPHQGGMHASPCGHFRNGHFRVLQSEYFKAKRFQTVFVHDTFVNGRAETVLSPEQADSEQVKPIKTNHTKEHDKIRTKTTTRYH